MHAGFGTFSTPLPIPVARIVTVTICVCTVHLGNPPPPYKSINSWGRTYVNLNGTFSILIMSGTVAKKNWMHTKLYFYRLILNSFAEMRILRAQLTQNQSCLDLLEYKLGLQKQVKPGFTNYRREV